MFLGSKAMYLSAGRNIKIEKIFQQVGAIQLECRTQRPLYQHKRFFLNKAQFISSQS